MSYRKYDSDFKENAVKLVIEGGRKVPDVAKSLGIENNLLYRWKALFLKDKNKAFPGKGNPRDEEMMRLKKENANIKLERDILKKALAVFSRDEK